LATAYAEVSKAEAQSRIALASLLPSINASATGTHQFITNRVTTIQNITNGTQNIKTLTTPSSDYISGNITVVQSLVDVKAWHDLGTARAAEVVQRLGIESVKRTMTLSLATSIVAVVTAERVAEINRIGLRSALELSDLTNRKRSLGAATGLDTVRAEQNVASARAAIVSGDESLRQSREALGMALGEPQQVAVAAALKLDGVLDGVGQTCRRLNNSTDRPELAAGRQQLVVAERGIRSVELSFLPTLKAQSAVSSSTLDPGAAPKATWNIQAVLTVPIWDGGARYGSLRSARAVRDEAAYSIESTQRSVTIEVEQARRAVQVAEQSVAVARNAATLAARNDELTRISYRLGQGTTSFELVAAAVALQQAQIQLAVQEFGVVGSRLTALLTMARCTD
jgi:outer membrane protein TolC